MRRLYESGSPAADDDDPFAPGRDGDDAGWIPWTSVGDALVPAAVRRRAVTARVETNREAYAPDDVVRFRVTFRNRLPVPIALRTASPVRWTWSIDGVEEASRVADRTSAPDDPALFEFARSERKTFYRQWHQRFREGPDEWSAARSGEYTLRVRIDGPSDVTAGTTFRID
jgi:hypothetical protein